MKNKYNEVAVLPAGFSFGELALINNKPRAATIRAKTGWFFAVLNKEDYQKVLGVIYSKELNRKVDFFISIPMFSDWTRGAIEKLTYYFKSKEFKRNHYLYRQGDPCDYWYIVAGGEFEATKLVDMSNKEKTEETLMKDVVKKTSNKLQNSKLFKMDTGSTSKMEEYGSDKFNSPTKNKNDIGNPILNSKMSKTKDTQFISLYGKGYLIGDNDAYFKRHSYTTSVKWSSTNGKVFYISNKELFRWLKYREDSMKMLEVSAIDKDQDVFKKLGAKENFIQKSKRYLNDFNIKSSNFYGNLRQSMTDTF